MYSISIYDDDDDNNCIIQEYYTSTYEEALAIKAVVKKYPTCFESGFYIDNVRVIIREIVLSNPHEIARGLKERRIQELKERVESCRWKPKLRYLKRELKKLMRKE